MFDIVLLEKPGLEGITIPEITAMMAELNEDEAYPVEIGDINGNSSAMGFIAPKAAYDIDYEYDQNSELGNFISGILDDMNKESDNGEYNFGKLKILMKRNFV